MKRWKTKIPEEVQIDVARDAVQYTISVLNPNHMKTYLPITSLAII